MLSILQLQLLLPVAAGVNIEVVAVIVDAAVGDVEYVCAVDVADLVVVVAVDVAVVVINAAVAYCCNSLWSSMLLLSVVIVIYVAVACCCYCY